MRTILREQIEFIAARKSGKLYLIDLRYPRLYPDQFSIVVLERSYKTIKKVLQSRPFDKTPGLKYQHFFLYSGGQSQQLFYKVVLNRQNKDFGLLGNTECLLKLEKIKEMVSAPKFIGKSGSERSLRHLVRVQAPWNFSLALFYFRVKYLKRKT